MPGIGDTEIEQRHSNIYKENGKKTEVPFLQKDFSRQIALITEIARNLSIFLEHQLLLQSARESVLQDQNKKNEIEIFLRKHGNIHEEVLSEKRVFSFFGISHVDRQQLMVQIREANLGKKVLKIDFDSVVEKGENEDDTDKFWEAKFVAAVIAAIQNLQISFTENETILFSRLLQENGLVNLLKFVIELQKRHILVFIAEGLMDSGARDGGFRNYVLQNFFKLIAVDSMKGSENNSNKVVLVESGRRPKDIEVSSALRHTSLKNETEKNYLLNLDIVEENPEVLVAIEKMSEQELKAFIIKNYGKEVLRIINSHPQLFILRRVHAQIVIETTPQIKISSLLANTLIRNSEMYYFDKKTSAFRMSGILRKAATRLLALEAKTNSDKATRFLEINDSIEKYYYNFSENTAVSAEFIAEFLYHAGVIFNFTRDKKGLIAKINTLKEIIDAKNQEGLIDNIQIAVDDDPDLKALIPEKFFNKLFDVPMWHMLVNWLMDLKISKSKK